VYLLRHLVVDQALHRIFRNAQAPPAHARPHPSGFRSLLDWIEAPGFGTARTGPGARMRASDAEREEVVAFLKHHYAAGRIDDDELNARVEAAYRSVTVTELERLILDLPSEPSPSAAPPARSRSMRRPVVALASLGLIAILATAVVSMIPAELWALLLTLILPFAVLALFAVLPLAVPALAAFLLARGGSEPPHLGPGHRPRVLTPPRGRGWVGVWRL